MMTYMSRGQLCGCSIRSPLLSMSMTCSVGNIGYGVPPRVKISHRQIPKDHLRESNSSHLICQLARLLHLRILRYPGVWSINRGVNRERNKQANKQTNKQTNVTQNKNTRDVKERLLTIDQTSSLGRLVGLFFNTAMFCICIGEKFRRRMVVALI